MTPQERRIQYLTITAAENKRMLDHNGGSQKYGQKHTSEYGRAGRSVRKQLL